MSCIVYLKNCIIMWHNRSGEYDNNLVWPVKI